MKKSVQTLLILILGLITSGVISGCFLTDEEEDDNSALIAALLTATNSCQWDASGVKYCIDFDSNYPHKSTACTTYSGTLISACSSTTYDSYVGKCTYTDDGYNHVWYYYEGNNADQGESYCNSSELSGTWEAAR